MSLAEQVLDGRIRNHLTRQTLINELMLDMIANTDCSWAAATAAVAFWEHHYKNTTAPVYGVVDFEDEKSNVVYENGPRKRSVKVGMLVNEEEVWYLTIS